MIVTCCELAPRVGDLSHNLQLAAAAITAAASSDVIVLPELVTSGYCFETSDEARSVALAADDPVFDEWQQLAGASVLAAGFAELGSDGVLYNSAVLFDGRGGRTVYRKTHLWDREKLFFTPGSVPPPVVDTRLGRLGLMICYDLEFPEQTRSVALRGAELLLVPTNWPWGERPDGWPNAEVVIAMAAARVNRMPIACCDRRGVERGQAWNEGTSIIDADGWPIATADESGFARAELDLLDGHDKRISDHNDVHADRRPELY